MKRSTMVTELSLLLSECSSDGFNNLETADAALDLMESHGMLPPWSELSNQRPNRTTWDEEADEE